MIREKKINLEILRILACFLVIVNHTNSRIFLSITPSKTWYISLIYFFISKIAVPIFIMISGAVLLGKEESYKDIFNKRIFKILLVIIIFSFIYYMDNIITTKKIFDLKNFFIGIYEIPITNAFWYLYMYLGLLIMLPIIRKMVNTFILKDYLYCFVIWGIYFGILPILNKYFNFINLSSHFSISLFSGYVVYFILGYFIENKLEDRYFNKRKSIALVILSIICIVVSVYFTYKSYCTDSKKFLFMDNISLITISIPSISMFYLAKYIFSNIHKNISKVIKNISKCTFGIYLISDLLIKKFNFIYLYLVEIVNPLIAVFILEVSVFIIGFLTIFMLKKIPLIKKIV